MGEVKHTPGPWALIQFGGPQIGNSETKEAVCTMWGDGGKMEANADLIVAAPDLLDALKTVTDRFRASLISNGTAPEYADLAVERFRETIAKAEGRF